MNIWGLKAGGRRSCVIGPSPLPLKYHIHFKRGLPHFISLSPPTPPLSASHLKLKEKERDLDREREQHTEKGGKKEKERKGKGVDKEAVRKRESKETHENMDATFQLGLVT